MTDTYVGVRDGYLHAKLAIAGQTVDLPAYAGEPSSAKTGEDLYRDMAHLVKPRTH